MAFRESLPIPHKRPKSHKEPNRLRAAEVFTPILSTAIVFTVYHYLYSLGLIPDFNAKASFQPINPNHPDAPVQVNKLHTIELPKGVVCVVGQDQNAYLAVKDPSIFNAVFSPREIPGSTPLSDSSTDKLHLRVPDGSIKPATFSANVISAEPDPKDPEFANVVVWQKCVKDNKNTATGQIQRWKILGTDPRGNILALPPSLWPQWPGPALEIANSDE